jgi:hypothetical protein
VTQTLQEIRVCMDIGSREHYVGIGLSTGERLDEFKLAHTPEAIKEFFLRIEKLNAKYNFPVIVAMEGYNGYARPIDSMVLDKGYKLYNVNNMKLARFKEIFPGPAKSDPIDTWMIFDLFAVKDVLPPAKEVLQEITKPAETDERLKRLTRRRRDLVNEKVQVVNRIQADLESICPGILSITGAVDNIWFLNFLTAREDDITKLIRVQRSSILKIKGVGKKYAQTIENWQKTAQFSTSSSWVGEMVISDAKRILELHYEISRLNKSIEDLIPNSEVAKRLITIEESTATFSWERPQCLPNKVNSPSPFEEESTATFSWVLTQ